MLIYCRVSGGSQQEVYWSAYECVCVCIRMYVGVKRRSREIEGEVKRMAKSKGLYCGIMSVWVTKMGCMTSLC